MVAAYQASFTALLPQAMQLLESSVRVFRGDVRVILVNVRLGFNSVLGTPNQVNFVKQHLPQLPLADVQDVPDLARALVFAAGKVIGRRKSEGDIEAALSRVSVLRAQLLQQAEVLAEAGKLDKHVVAQIRKGRGKFDLARDGLDLAGLYTDQAAAIAGKHPFTVGDIENLRKDSEWLLEHLTPMGARKEVLVKSDEADVRDRFWTLLAARYAHIRAIGYYLHGDDFDAYTPKLGSRIASKTIEEVGNESVAAPVVN